MKNFLKLIINKINLKEIKKIYQYITWQKIFIAFLALFILLVFIRNSKIEGNVVRGKVLEVYDNIFSVGILEGKYAKKKVSIKREDQNNNWEISPQKNDLITVLQVEKDSQETTFYIQDFEHTRGLFAFLLLFLIIFALVAKKEGLRALFALSLSFFAIFKILLPAAYNADFLILKTFIIANAIAILSLLILLKFSRKAFASILGTFFGITTATFTVILISHFAKITGLANEDIRMLLINSPQINVKGILFSGIILSALGAVMDTAVSIASAINELSQSLDKNLSKLEKFKKLFTSGMNVGRDVLGSMINTLIFAFTGSAFAILVLFAGAHDLPLFEILNYEFVSSDIMMALSGSFALTATVPSTALAGALLESYGFKK